MENWNGAVLCKEARQLSRGEDKRKLSAIHAGITAGVALVITLAQYLLAAGIDKTGGLSGMGMRSILQTAATFLNSANTILMPFWNLGFFFAALLWVRQQRAEPGDLLQGFRRFGPALRLWLTKALLVFCMIMVCAYIASFAFMATPWAAPITEFAQEAGMDLAKADAMMNRMDGAQINALLQSLIPMLVIWGALFLVLAVPVLYKLRMAEYMILDQKAGAVAAMLISARMLRKRCWKLFLLDLRFWWYYTLEVLCLLIYCADLWLPMLGIPIPQNEGVVLGLYVLYLVALFGVHTLLRPRVQTAYAMVYEHLRQAEPVLPKTRPQPDPKTLPWDPQ